MAEQPDKPEEQFPINLPQPGIKGLNTLDDQKVIDDLEMADCRNVYFDDGMLTPRTGSTLFATKPTGETNPALQIFTATTYDKVDYIIGVWGSNFYVWDDNNEQWIKINGSYVPIFTTLIHGTANWIKGAAGSDIVYGGNGKDHSWKWQMGISYLASPALSADGTLTFADSTRLGTSGTISLVNAGAETAVGFKANNTTTGQLTLNSTVGANFSTGTAAVTTMVDENANIPIGAYFNVWQVRLIVSGGLVNPTLVSWSVTDNPESFSGSGATAGGSQYITDGDGPITGQVDEGSYFLISKRDLWLQMNFQLSADLATYQTNLIPVVSGDSVGTLNQYSLVKADNVVYYPTAANGLYSLSPVTTSTTTTIQTQLLSEKINPTINSILSFQNGQTAYYNQKLLFACGVPNQRNLVNSNSVAVKNTIVVMYDMVYQSWVFFDTWDVQGWTIADYNLYYISNVDGNIYQTFVGQDDNGNAFIPFVLFKEMDFGSPAIPKRQDLVFVEGLIDPGTLLYCNVMFNRKGALGIQTFVIDGSANYVSSVPLIPLGGNASLGQIALGSGVTQKNQSLVNSLADNTGFFRVYLNINFSYGFFTLQLKFYSQNDGDYWGLLNVSHNPTEAPTTPKEFIIGPNT